MTTMIEGGWGAGCATPDSSRARARALVRGAVQGVGFRPAVYRLALELNLAGWVGNSAQGVTVEVEGWRNQIEAFLIRLEAERPPRSFIQGMEVVWLDPAGQRGFEIRSSAGGGERSALILPDIATCPDCLRELNDPGDRRHRYPFINCTNCGPRHSIITALPYDRAHTTMSGFRMCARCEAEYRDPLDRRFHAQPNACPECGPRLELWARMAAGLPETSAAGEAALGAAAAALLAGRILAVKGLGGFQLMCRARDEAAVRRLRERKHREEKPLALMFPSLPSVLGACEVSPLEERVLRSAEAPIVLLRRRSAASWLPAPSVAPRNPYLGVMLPYTPLHHLLLRAVGEPVVATSGNLSDEPICVEEREAWRRLAGLADLFLVHNRPIARPVDDSVVRIVMGRESVARRARGYAPLPVALPRDGPAVLAVGAQLKNTVALALGRQAFVSQHIGDLETVQAGSAFDRAVADLETLHGVAPAIVAADLHPDYFSTRRAVRISSRPGGPRLVRVQHHLAHVFACLAENELTPPVLGVAWDGTGYGEDHTIWGGEFFLVTDAETRRVAHLRGFRLPGGERAVREPRRAALGLLWELAPAAVERLLARAPRTQAAFRPRDLAVVRRMLERRLNSPLTSSAGRLFDAAASLAGVRQINSFEGQAAMELEFSIITGAEEPGYPVELGSGPEGTLILDWAPLVGALLDDLSQGLPAGRIAARFHHGLAEGITRVARHFGIGRVALAGGCFGNRYLLEATVRRLEAAGQRAYWPQRVPPNDGGIALGQIVAARRMKE